MKPITTPSASSIRAMNSAPRSKCTGPRSAPFLARSPASSNTELIYNNDLAHFVSHMGYDAVVCEGADKVLGARSPNFLYRPPHAPRLKLLLKNYRLSDDIAYRFGNKDWEQYPLTAEKFAQWVNHINGNGFICNLFMDYETFGERQWADTGIFEFLRHFPARILDHADNDFLTPSQAV